MKALNFKEANIQLAKDQPEYMTLPVFVDYEDINVPMVSVWEPTPEELEDLKLGGKIVLRQLTFGKPFQPINLSVHHVNVIPHEKENESPTPEQGGDSTE